MEGCQRCEAFRELSKRAYDLRPDLYIPSDKDTDVPLNGKTNTLVPQAVLDQFSCLLSNEDGQSLTGEEFTSKFNALVGEHLDTLLDKSNSQQEKSTLMRNPYNRVIISLF